MMMIIGTTNIFSLRPTSLSLYSVAELAFVVVALLVDRLKLKQVDLATLVQVLLEPSAGRCSR